MNDIVITQDPKLVHMGNAVQNLLNRQFVHSPAQTTTLITKTQGGVGADIFASVLAFFFEQHGLIAPIFQAGGTKGPLCDAYQMPRLNRVPLYNPSEAPLDQQLSNFLGTNAGGPAIVIISPEANALALGIITTIVDAGLPIKFHNIHLMRPPSASLTMPEQLKPLCISSVVATVEALTYPAEHDQMLLIPRFPGALIDQMEEKRWTFETAMENADLGVKIAMLPKFMRFLQQLSQFYA